MTEYKCTNCKKVLLEASFLGCILKKCPRCKTDNEFIENTLPSAAMLTLIKHEEAICSNPISNNA